MPKPPAIPEVDKFSILKTRAVNWEKDLNATRPLYAVKLTTEQHKKSVSRLYYLARNAKDTYDSLPLQHSTDGTWFS